MTTTSEPRCIDCRHQHQGPCTEWDSRIRQRCECRAFRMAPAVALIRALRDR